MKKLMRLRPKKTLQNDFFVCDTETGVRKHDVIEWQLRGRPENFIFACLVGRNMRKEFHSLDELKKEFLKPEYKKRKVFFHNAEYDLNVIYGCIFQLDPQAIFNGKFICATNGNCQFADSLNIFKTSVKELGKMLGMQKQGMSDKGSYTNSNWNNKEERIRDINGCYRDCEIVWEALVRVFEDAGDIKITQASLSMTYFRRFHQPYDIEHNENTAFFFDSYYGGRTELFEKGPTHARVIDRNSSYPDQMEKLKFPNPAKLQVATNVKVNAFLKFILYNYEGLVYCTVNHARTTFGFLPYKSNGKLYFPTGIFTGCWNFNEIRFALDKKAITISSISRIVYAPPIYSPFREYVNHLYKKRFSTDNEFEIYRIKIFMNSLYGKFAQRITEEMLYIENIEKEIQYVRDLQRKGLVLKIVPFNAERLDCFLILKCQKKIDVSFCIPSFASYITSGARIELLKKMLELESKKVIYCDTDSVFFKIDDGSIKNEYHLGGWKVEDKIITAVWGLKNYRFIDPKKAEKKKLPANTEFLALKGIPENAKKIDENIYIYENLVKTKEALRRGLDAGVKISRKKVISGIYDKRIVHADGTTEPIFITP